MRMVFSVVYTGCLLLTASALAQSPVTLTVNTQSPGAAVPADFLGLSFETGNLQNNGVGVSGYMFDSTNTELVTLFTNLGIKSLRIGGISVEARNGIIPQYTPTNQDIDALFRFAKAAGVKVVFSLRLENGNPAQDAAIASYTWTNYSQYLTCLAIGNEPNAYPASTGMTNFSSYLATWTSFAAAITDVVPDAKFGGPDSSTAAWVPLFANAQAGSSIVTRIFSHDYAAGNSSSLTVTQTIAGMLSSGLDTSAYPNYYNTAGAVAVADGFPFRLTEFNSYVASYPGVWGGNNSFASALFALDGAHWWAAHNGGGVNFHTFLGKYNGTVFYDANSNYQIFPIAYGMKAFDLGSHGSVLPVAISNTDGLNLTAYAVSDPTNLYVTIVNKEYGANARDASVTILPSGFGSGNVSAMFLVATNGNVFATNDATLGGATITNNAPWLGQWTTLNPLTNGQCVVAVPAGSAAVVKIYNVILFIPPLIVTNLPQRVFVVPGQVYQYSVGAEGGLPLSYQWYQDATPVAGQTNATYAVTAGSVGSSTSYFVAITNIYASVTSSVSTLTVIAPPTNSLATTIEQLNPAGYWPMHEVESAAHGDIETNYGDLGLLGTAYYPDWANANNHIIARGVPGALAYDSDPAVNFTYAGGANGVGPAAGTYTNVLAVPHTSPLATLNPPFSVECWFYPTNTSSQDIWDQTGFEGLNAGSSGGAAGNVGGIRLVWSNGTNTGFQVYSYYNNSTVISEGFSGNPGGPPAAPRNHWYHLVVTCNLNTNISLYTNGVMAFTTPAIGLYTPDFWTPLTIGGGRGGTKAVAGYIDEFAVYTNVLSTNDILQHYSDGVGESQAGAYVAAVLADNPVIYLRMDAPSYTPPASATWPKLLNLGSAGIPGVYSPGTMPGILSGPISSSGAPFGGVTNNSALFSGVSSFADAGNVSAFNPTGSNANFAVMALFRGNPCDGRTQSIVGHGASSWQLGLTTEGKIVFNAGNGNKTAGATGSSAGDIQTAGVYNDGNWHQVAAVNQTNAISIYVDGVLDTYGTPAGITTTNIIPGNTDDVIIGSDPSYTNSPAGVGRTFAGQICDVAFFTNALTAAQIAAIYLSASTPLPETLTLTKAGNSQLQLNWSHGTLQTATNVTGPYNDVTNASQPYTIHTTNSQQFYRVMQN